MGILSSLFAAVSGLNANGSALSVIGNNIANTGTVGFKSGRANFSDIISASLGGTAASGQVGIGVRLAGIQSNFTQGSLQTTNNALDLAADGNGFFRVTDAAGGNFYTRAGQFNINKDGDVVNPNGFKLQGFQADSSGAITGGIATINLTTTTSPPVATTTVTISANLNSGATTQVFALTNPAGTSNFSTALTVFDSLGNSHLATVYFTKTAATTWDYNITANTSEVTAANYNAANKDTTLGITRVGKGTLTFTAAGALDIESVVTRFDDGTAGGTAGTVAGKLQVDFSGATQDQLITFNYGTSLTTDSGATGLDGTTQFGSQSALVNQSQNGFGAGSLQGVSVASNGVISGRFSNGQLRTLAQVALTRFNNANGLAEVGKNLLAETADSGAPINGKPDSSGLGRVLSSSLELSNVDLGEEFINLISAQRGFQANARVVTTVDEILGELVNLKR